MSRAAVDGPVVDVHLDPAWAGPALAADVRAGLTSVPRELPPKWFYDDHGSDLFDRITRVPEYYPFRREREILEGHASTIAETASAEALVELGSGTSEKTRLLLDAMRAEGTLARYVPFDVSEQTLRDAAAGIAERYPGLAIHGVVGDFDHHLGHIPRSGRQLVVLLGGTIGNFAPAARASFLATVAAAMAPGDHLLLGTDLVKDPARLEAAYDDADGVTAAFNKNVLSVINRSLDADFDLDGFDHRSRFDPEHEWIEMLLVANRAQTVHIAALDLDASFAAGEVLRTEISAKFRRGGVEGELAAAGLDLVRWMTDAGGDFAVSLSRRG